MTNESAQPNLGLFSIERTCIFRDFFGGLDLDLYCETEYFGEDIYRVAAYHLNRPGEFCEDHVLYKSGFLYEEAKALRFWNYMVNHGRRLP